MRDKAFFILIGILFAAILGCSSAVVIGDRVIGVESGKFIYSDGAATCDYSYPFEKVWDASVKTISDMKPLSIVKDKKISKGEIEAVVKDEKVKVSVSYSSSSLTTVSVRVGLAGDNIASKMILDTIKENLSRS